MSSSDTYGSRYWRSYPTSPDACGYGGTAVLWKCGIDHLITTLPDGGISIQCVEVKGSEPILLVLINMPCNGIQGCVDKFED